VPRDTHPAPSDVPRFFAAPTAACALVVAGLAAAAVAAIPNPGFAQEARSMTTRGQGQANEADRAAVAALGLDLASIEQCHDAALLWRAVRELVLPGRVAEATQRRILRRVWSVDPEISQGSYVDSPTY